MRVRELISMLSSIEDQEMRVLVGTVTEVGAGLVAHAETDLLFVTNISNYIVIHTKDPKKRNTEGNKAFVSNFE